MKHELPSSQVATATLASPLPDNGAEDLSRFCLEKDTLDERRTLAWVNSICLIFLLIGLFGVKQPALQVNRKPVVVEEAVPTVIEPVVPAVAVITPDAPSDEPPGPGSGGGDGGDVVAVTVDSSAVAFSVPTVGNVLVPLGMAPAPPPNPMRPVAPVMSVQIESITTTGSGGSRPAPPYPLESLRRKEEGTVVLLLEVDNTGRIINAQIKESSGYRRLDQATLDYVVRHWLINPGRGKQVYEAPITYQLK
jgi:TonB family protein